MQYRTIPITLDLSASVPFHPFEVVDGDTGNVLDITLTNGGEAMLLNGCTLCIAYSSSAGFAMQDEESGITLGTEAGKLTVWLDPKCYGPGNVSADVQIYSGAMREVLITSKRFDFRCRSTLISEAIIRANQAFPPLTSAAQSALRAASAANAAAAALNETRGELNVQADWLESDGTSDAYIRHKPVIPSDAAAIGAASAEAFNAHAARHASDGLDAITPESIGAARVQTFFAALGTAWTGTEAPFTQEVTVNGLLGTDTPIVDMVASDVFETAEAEAAAWASVYRIVAGTNKLTVYASEAAETAINLQIKAVR